MTKEQRVALAGMLRNGPLDIGKDVQEQREIFDGLLRAVPLAQGVTCSEEKLGGVEIVRLTPENAGPGLLLYFHGGAYALGSAAAQAGFVSEFARRLGCEAISVNYRKAPEHPFPAALDDALAVYREVVGAGEPIVMAGDSAGGGLVLSSLVRLVAEKVAVPVAAVAISPWADLAQSGWSATGKAAQDPALNVESLSRRAADYLAERSADDPGPSPAYADLRGLPPLLIQVGSYEVLLDDALAIAAHAARADVDVTLRVWSELTHVFPTFLGVLDEASDGLDEIVAYLTRQLEKCEKEN